MSQTILYTESTVWLTGWSNIKQLTNPEEKNILQYVSIYPFNPKSPPEGYCLIGDAIVTITLHDPKEITKNKIEVLTAEKTKIMADSQAKCIRIDKQIQSILAIEMR